MLLHDPKAVTQSLNNVNEIIHLITVWLLGIQVNYAAPIGGTLTKIRALIVYFL